MKKMKFKKIITLAIALVLTTTQALAASPADLLKELKIEKSFVLKVLISPWAGRTIRDLGSKKIFYITDCNGKCRAEKAGVLSALKKFAQDYNEIIGREFVMVDSNITSGNSNHHTQVELIQNKFVKNKSVYLWECDEPNKIKNIRGFCHIRLSTKLKQNLNYSSAFKAINTLGIYIHRKSKYKNCLVYEPPYNGSFFSRIKHRKNGYQGMCENEKRTIVFFDKYLKPGMRKNQVEKMFDKHWVSDTTLALDKIDPNWREKEIEKAPKKAITKKTFSTQQGGNR